MNDQPPPHSLQECLRQLGTRIKDATRQQAGKSLTQNPISLFTASANVAPRDDLKPEPFLKLKSRCTLQRWEAEKKVFGEYFQRQRIFSDLGFECRFSTMKMKLGDQMGRSMAHEPLGRPRNGQSALGYGMSSSEQLVQLCTPS